MTIESALAKAIEGGDHPVLFSETESYTSPRVVALLLSRTPVWRAAMRGSGRWTRAPADAWRNKPPKSD